MDIRPIRGSRVVILAGVIALVQGASPWSADAQAVRPETREEARGFLRALVRTDATEARVAAALEALEADDYAERVRGTRALLSEPRLPEELVRKAMKEGSADLRLRLKQIRDYHTDGRLVRVLAATLRLIADEQWKGLGPDVVAAVEGRTEDGGKLWQAALAAMAATALPEDEALLREALGKAEALGRGVGLAGLIALEGGGSVEEIAALATDPNRLNVLQVADFLRARKDRRCLAAYISLLDADDFAVRMAAARALGALTGKTLGYDAAARGPKRRAAVLGWRSWLEGEGETGALNFEAVPAGEVVLFDGISLEGWSEVGVDDLEAGWVVEEGSLVCTGDHHAGTTLRTEAAFADYHLRLEFRLPFGQGDSGVGIFVGADEVAVPSCLEVQVLSGKTGDLYRIGDLDVKDGGGQPIPFQKEREGEPEEMLGDWNLLECVVAEGTVIVHLNGVEVNRATECPTEPLGINLRNEGHRVEFRNLVLTPVQP